VQRVDVDDPVALLPVVQTILDGGLWGQFRKIPVDALARVLARLDLRPETRRLVEIWIEEAPNRAA
jgi:hypothetical protein